MARRLYIGNYPTNLSIEEGETVASTNLSHGSSLLDSVGAAGEDGQVLTKQDGKFKWKDSAGSSGYQDDFVAGENVNQFQCVRLGSDGKAYKTDAGTLSHAGCAIGIATTSATTGNTVTVKTSGVLENDGWSWTPGQPVYVGASGALTQSVGVGVFQQQLGIAFSATEMELDIELPIILV